MISPTPEIRRVITDPNDVPRINHVSDLIIIRSEYLGIIWQLSVDLLSKEAVLASANTQSDGNIEIIRNIARLDKIENIDAGALRKHLELLISKYAYKDFV
jgi:hypothetical protein